MLEDPALDQGAMSTAAKKAPPQLDLCEQLDCTLDYIMKFLEGDHAKSANTFESTRTRILDRVKTTIQWRLQAPSHDEVQGEIACLNSMMSDIVAKL